MNPTEDPNAQPNPGAGTAPGSSATPTGSEGQHPSSPAGYDPAEVEQLRQEAAAYRQLSQTLSPYADDIRRIVEDEDARNFYRESLRTRDLLQQQQRPQTPPELQPIVEKVDRVASWIDKQEQQTKQQTEAQVAEQQRKTYEAFQKVAQSNPWLIENGQPSATAQAIAVYGDRRGITDFGQAFEAYQNEMRERFGGAQSAPPRSLRADAGASPGVPGPRNSEPAIKGPEDIRARLAANLRAQRRAAG